MRGSSTVYCDGVSLDVAALAADLLAQRRLIVPHPGAGADGITGGDWTLAEGVAWQHVYELVRPDGYLTEAGQKATGVYDARTAALYRQDARP